ncbi:MAG: hypothetical protein GX576_05390 [Thauera phenolivorans]|uniref:Uncharacterized protein n=1 Tax=Thauera phenolivorans TaxID=1792543 RepID=A0A7X7LV81_9RHOO|nr:hypothetical protein [Thauera phenolivorans]NLF53823.1 hypothetical protein [Thauera phenolivorans]
MSRRLAALLLTLSATLAHPALAAEPQPSAAVQSPEARSEALKDEGRRLRAEAEATYLDTERACYDRFLVNRCIDQAKAKRLETIRRARELEAEARRIDLAERRRLAEERGLLLAPAPLERPAEPDFTPAPATASTPPVPAPIPAPASTTEADRLRAQRAAEARAADAAARAAQAERDAERATERARAEREAAARAEAAARDRARYDERIRQYEAEQAKEKAGQQPE